MASPKTLALRAIRPHPTLLGPYIQVTEKDSTGTKFVRDSAAKAFKSRDGTTYMVSQAGAILLYYVDRQRGIKPHPRGGVRRMKFSR